jgi:tetratricopeptide (TPR) repeat protein
MDNNLTSRDSTLLKSLGRQLGEYAQGQTDTKLSPVALQGVVSDLAAEMPDLQASLRDLVSRQSFTAIIQYALSGRGMIQRDALIQEISRLYHSDVLRDLKEVLNGFLAESGDNSSSRNQNASTGLMSQGDNQGAIADYNQAIAINPRDSEAYKNRGLTKNALGDNQGAIADYNQAIAINPIYSDAYYNRGNAKYQLGDKQGAIADYNQAIAINPRFSDAYSNRGYAKSQLGDKQGALADYSQAIVINPRLSLAYNNRGNVKRALGDKQGAIADYNQAIAINPKYSDAYCNRGILKRDLGDKQGACSDFKKAASLGD